MVYQTLRRLGDYVFGRNKVVAESNGSKSKSRDEENRAELSEELVEHLANSR